MQVDTNEGAPSERVPPILQYSVLCDGVAQDPNLKLLLLGVFDNLLRPVTVPQFFIVNKWANGVGRFTQTLEILKPDLTPNSPPADAEFEVTNRALSATHAQGYVNYNFPDIGVYWVQIKLDGALVLAYPLPVLQPADVVQG